MTLLKKLLILGIILTLSAAAGTFLTADEPTPAENEILLEINPHVRDDVFLMEAGFSISGEPACTQGVCNANLRSPLQGSVYFSLLTADFPADADMTKLSVSLSVQNEPFAGNTMNTNQTNLIPVQNEIFLPAEPGEHYVLILREDRADGYYLTVLKGTLLSPDGRYSAVAAFENKGFSEKSMVEITIHDTWCQEQDFVFSPVHSLDFCGLYWEDGRLAVDSSDVGILYYEKDAEGNWVQVPYAQMVTIHQIP